MKIRAKLILSVICFSIITLVVAITLVVTIRRVDDLNAREAIADRLLLESHELSELSNDYILFHAKRQSTQWEIKYNSMAALLAQLHASRPQEQALVDSIAASHKRLKEIFDDVRSTVETGTLSKKHGADIGFLQLSWSRLTVKTQGMIHDVSQLVHFIKGDTRAVEYQTIILIMAMICALVVFSVVNYIFISWRVLGSVATLKNGTEIIGSGNLDYRIEETGKDEIADLARAFNRMNADLATVMASREQLDMEIAERKRAEETLKESERSLSLRDRVSRVFLTVPDDEMYGEVLAIILEVMKSQYGVFGYLDEDGALVVPTMTRTIWEQCNVPDKDIVFPRCEWGNSTWPRCIREQKTIYSNDPSNKIPAGHISVLRHISMPILYQGGAIGLFQVANKSDDYTSKDIEVLENIAGHVAPILSARLRRDREEGLRKRAEDQLKKMVEDLERSNKELEQFAYVASHDLQEPLRMVSSYTQLLAERYGDQLDEKAKKFINYSVDGAIRMQQLIHDLLSFSRITTRGAVFENVDSNTALRMAIANLAEAIHESGALVTNDDLPGVLADQMQLVQVFQNLLGNAIKFRGQEQPRIHVSVQEQNSYWLFSVKDNGIGIESQYKDKVFVIFQRLHTREEFPGTGIGLALCQRIVQRHGGAIWFDSKPGEGSTFFFTLPKIREEEHSDGP